MITLPTSNDITIQVNGRNLAVAQGYKLKTSRESRSIEAFGSAAPVGTIGGQTKYVIELSRVYVTGNLSDGIDFYQLENFNLVIAKPDRRIVFSGCQWASIGENAALGDLVLENVVIIASKRQVLQ